MTLVSCSTCRHFEKDPIGDGMGLGDCRVLNVYLKKKPSQTQINEALVALGNRPENNLFWGGSPSFKHRKCTKYEF